MPIIIESLLLIFGTACGIACRRIAMAKGRSPWWFLAGFFLNLLGVVIVIAASDVKAVRELRSQIADLKKDLKKLIYRSTVEFDTTRDQPVCSICSHFEDRTGFCGELGVKPKASTATCKLLMRKDS